MATSNVECYRLDKHAFDDIMQSRPEIAEDISEVLARRRAELDAVREDLSEEGEARSDEAPIRWMYWPDSSSSLRSDA